MHRRIDIIDSEDGSLLGVVETWGNMTDEELTKLINEAYEEHMEDDSSTNGFIPWLCDHRENIFVLIEPNLTVYV